MKSRSQHRQDVWVWKSLGQPKTGWFMDIGASHPVTINNTFGLEEIGWEGYAFDNNPDCPKLFREANRQAKFFCVDVTAYEWDRMLPKKTFDYISIDVDYATLDLLKRFPFKRYPAKLMTVEHDHYQYPGDQSPRGKIREILHGAGYKIACMDVCGGDDKNPMPFEDWWYNPIFEIPDLITAKPGTLAHRIV